MNEHNNYIREDYLAILKLYTSVTKQRDKLREALDIIANEDYRGNRPQSAFIAEKALNSIKP